MRSGDHFHNSIVSCLVQSIPVYQISCKSPPTVWVILLRRDRQTNGGENSTPP